MKIGLIQKIKDYGSLNNKRKLNDSNKLKHEWVIKENDNLKKINTNEYVQPETCHCEGGNCGCRGQHCKGNN
ncbi:MAG: hypothetical protein ABIE74_03785 [Pseudomonadota bacterium]